MATIFQELFKNEFVVDEKPEDVLAPEALAVKRLPPGERHVRAPETGEDLLGQVAGLLLEHERLEEMADALRARKSAEGGVDPRRFLKSALPLLDSLDRILRFAEEQEQTESMKNWIKSIAALQSRMTTLYSRYGLRPMDPVGKKVDLNRHEVVEVLHTDSIPDETVVEVRQKGYLYEGKVLRDAQVVVAKNERR